MGPRRLRDAESDLPDAAARSRPSPGFRSRSSGSASGNASPIFLIFISSVFPMVVQTTAGVHTIERRYLRAAENFGVSRCTLFRRVVIPAVLPQIIVGMRIGLGVAWLVVVAAEMIALRSGLGLSHHRFAQRRQPLRSGDRGHDHHRADRAPARRRDAAAGRARSRCGGAMPVKIVVQDIKKTFASDKGPLPVLERRQLQRRRRRVRRHRRSLRLRQVDAAEHHRGIRSAPTRDTSRSTASERLGRARRASSSPSTAPCFRGSRCSRT